MGNLDNAKQKDNELPEVETGKDKPLPQEAIIGSIIAIIAIVVAVFASDYLRIRFGPVLIFCILAGSSCWIIYKIKKPLNIRVFTIIILFLLITVVFIPQYTTTLQQIIHNPTPTQTPIPCVFTPCPTIPATETPTPIITPTQKILSWSFYEQGKGVNKDGSLLKNGGSISLLANSTLILQNSPPSESGFPHGVFTEINPEKTVISLKIKVDNLRSCFNTKDSSEVFIGISNEVDFEYDKPNNDLRGISIDEISKCGSFHFLPRGIFPKDNTIIETSYNSPESSNHLFKIVIENNKIVSITLDNYQLSSLPVDISELEKPVLWIGYKMAKGEKYRQDSFYDGVIITISDIKIE